MKNIIIGVAIIALAFWVANYFTYLQCANNVTEMNRQFRYDWMNGCRLQQKDGSYVYWQMYREINQ